jgi:hypothetical protein
MKYRVAIYDLDYEIEAKSREGAIRAAIALYTKMETAQWYRHCSPDRLTRGPTIAQGRKWEAVFEKTGRKRMWAALFLCGALLLTTISARAHDLDFPNQLRAINVCHTQWSKQHPGKAITEAPLVACMKAQGFRFDPNRQIKGVGPCHGNKTPPDHPDCYAEPPKTRASRTHPTA